MCANQNTKFPEETKMMADYLTGPEFVTEWLGESAAPILCPALVSVSQNEIWSRPENKILADAAEFHQFCGYPGDFTDYATEVYNQKLFATPREDYCRRILSRKRWRCSRRRCRM